MDAEISAGGADSGAPTGLFKAGFDDFQFLACGQDRLTHFFCGDLSVLETALCDTDATHIQTFHIQVLNPPADDHLGAAATDVHYQAFFAFVVHEMSHAQVYQARLLQSGDNLDAMSQGPARGAQKCRAVSGLTQGIGAHRPNITQGDLADALPEPFQALDGLCRCLIGEVIPGVESGSEPHHLLKFIDDLQAIVAIIGHDHVKTVGSQIHRDIGFVRDITHSVTSESGTWLNIK